MATKNDIEALYKRYLNNDLSEKELDEFLQLFTSPEDQLILSSLMDSTWKQMFDNGATVIPMHKPQKRSWYRVAAAITVLFIIAAIIYFVVPGDDIPDQTGQIEQISNDVAAPASTKATITFANGKQIMIDTAGNGTFAQEGNIKVTKLADGQIVYEGSSNELRYNTLTNPRGSKVISLTLVDGTKVWLNAESSLKYPTAFVGNERKVEITGEAYFEVNHDAEKKFFVEATGVITEVLGTHFNINSYGDEQHIKVTLLEGSVIVATQKQSTIIKPGQQAQVSEKIRIENADIDDVMAWKNGLFSFKRATIQTIMQQVARWYDVEVMFEGNIPRKHYSGETSRNLNLSQMLKVLEESGIEFRIEEKKIVVTN